MSVNLKHITAISLRNVRIQSVDSAVTANQDLMEMDFTVTV